MKILVCFSVLLFLTTSGWAESVVNGDFETTNANIGLHNGYPLNTLTSWDAYNSIPGWTLVSGPGIEVDTSWVSGFPAHSGLHYVELESDTVPGWTGPCCNSSMKQTLTLDVGAYVLSFWYRPRTDIPGDNTIVATLAGLSITADGTVSAMPDWTQFSGAFNVSTPGSYDLTLAATGPQDTVGGVIDDISVVDPAPEPGSFLMLGAGLACLAIPFCARKRRILQK